MKALHIVAILMSVAMGTTCFYYAEECSSARWEYLFNDIWGGYDSYSYNRAPDITMEAATICLAFYGFFALAYSFTIAKLKTTTAKVMSIIGVSLTGIFLLWNFAVLSNPSSLSFDEVGLAFIGFAVVMLAFSIVNLVQASKAEKTVRTDDSIVDDIV